MSEKGAKLLFKEVKDRIGNDHWREAHNAESEKAVTFTSFAANMYNHKQHLASNVHDNTVLCRFRAKQAYH